MTNTGRTIADNQFQGIGINGLCLLDFGAVVWYDKFVWALARIHELPVVKLQFDA